MHSGLIVFEKWLWGVWTKICKGTTVAAVSYKTLESSVQERSQDLSLYASEDIEMIKKIIPEFV